MTILMSLAYHLPVILKLKYLMLKKAHLQCSLLHCQTASVQLQRTLSLFSQKDHQQVVPFGLQGRNCKWGLFFIKEAKEDFMEDAPKILHIATEVGQDNEMIHFIQCIYLYILHIYTILYLNIATVMGKDKEISNQQQHVHPLKGFLSLQSFSFFKIEDKFMPIAYHFNIVSSVNYEVKQPLPHPCQQTGEKKPHLFTFLRYTEIYD